MSVLNSGTAEFFTRFPTSNSAYQALLEQIHAVLGLDVTVLLLGESGVGKGWMAQAIHECGRRRAHPFIKIDCANIPFELFESELFGFEKGAFTDANETKIGKVEMANAGTLYLDEVAALPMPVQAKMLRVLEEKEFMRLGGRATQLLDVRILCSSNTDLYTRVQAGLFRKDLFYRINIMSFVLPPLRERREDIPLLAAQLTRELADRYDKSVRSIAQEAHAILTHYPWRGNIRELRNVLERAVIICDDKRIQPEHLPTDAFVEEDFVQSALRSRWSLERLEVEYIRQILRLLRHNNSRAARILGISRKTLLLKRKKYGIP
jgi:two-component system response regulator AtoC